MALVASCQTEVVGFALLDTNCPTEALSSHFDLRQIVNIPQQQQENQAVIALFFLNPLFANRQRLFLREIMRQMTRTVLFLPVFQAYDVSNVLEDMVLVSGRWHASMYPPCTWALVSPQGSPSSRFSLRSSIQQSVAISATSSKIGQYLGYDCALFTMTHRLLSRQKTIVNSRIVVVGASQTGAVFLSKLITCTNLKFSSLTLVSPLGLKSLFDSSKTLLDVELGPVNAFQKMGINCLVNVVADTVIGLNRKAKFIHLLSGKSVQYDYLILSAGLQGQFSSTIQVDSNKGVVRLDELSIMVNENAFNFSEPGSPVVIYGLSLQTFCAIRLLLSKGMPGSLLVVAYPELEALDSFAEQCFEDSYIAASVMKEIRAAGVIERSGLKLLEVIPGEEKGVLQGVGFEKIFRASLNFSNQSNNGGICIKQPCRLLVACTQPHVDSALSRAVRKEGLVFNGRIVVDGYFQTNDPHIFACGSISKFSRQCGKHPNLEAFNSCEMGQTLAKFIISLFTDHLPSHDKLWGGLLPNPFEAVPSAKPVQNWPRTSIPRLIQAKGVSALLPGNSLYFNIKSPTSQYLGSKDTAMQPLILKKDDWLLKVELTKAREIGAISYCGNLSLEAWKFIRLVGCHDTLIGNLFSGNGKPIMNIINFFSQAWFTLIFHDKFLEFYTKLCLEAYHILKDSPQEQKLVQDVVKDGFMMFLNVYKADFPGLSISSPWVSSKSERVIWKGMEASSNTKRCSKARTRKQDDIVKELKENQDSSVCMPIKGGNEVADVHCDNQKDIIVAIAEQTSRSHLSEKTTDLSFVESEGTKPSVKEELELAVKRIVEQITKAEAQSSAARAGERGNELSDKEESELVVGKIVEQIIKAEAINRVSFAGRGMIEGEKDAGKLEVELAVRHIMEKLTGEQDKRDGVSAGTVKLLVVESEEAGVLVEKAQVKLVMNGEESSKRIRGVWQCVDANKSCEGQLVSVQLLIGDDQNEVAQDENLVQVQFDYPSDDGNQ